LSIREVIDMPRKLEIEQERDELKAKLLEAHAILGEALGFEEEDEEDDEDLDEGDDQNE
jgi:hypothetical protein